MQTKYQKSRSTRTEISTKSQTFRGGKLVPVNMTAVRSGESGISRMQVIAELDPIVGRLQSEITCEVTSVFVPALAIDDAKGGSVMAGNTDALRDRLATGEAIFGLEDRNEISMRAGIVSKPIGGVRKVSEVARLAHNVAVNFLRKRRYIGALEIDVANTSITPALLSSTVLDRLNGVLDPEDRINGAVDLSGQYPVKGIATNYNLINSPAGKTADGETVSYPNYATINPTSSSIHGIFVETDAAGYPQVRANFEGQLSLKDFYVAQRMDAAAREIDAILDANPELGFEAVANVAYGLSIDTGKLPVVMYETTKKFARGVQSAMDGPSLGDMQTSNLVALDFAIPVPATEFGGVLVTFVSVKPDESLSSMPHPLLTDSWAQDNFLADEMAIDPVPVLAREIDANVAAGSEDTVCLYVGNNHLRKRITSYGWTENTDVSTVAHKSAIWQYEIPASVSPSSILYPETLPHYPFADQNAEVVTCHVTSQIAFNTPTIFGPSPIENNTALDAVM
jgi:uncharacterized protein YqkB